MWPPRKRHWFAVILLSFAAAFVCECVAIWTGDARMALTGALFAAVTYFSFFGIVSADN